MELYELVTEVIDMRSFSNLWFWIALAVFWSMASHWVMGVPYDMIIRARRYGGQSQEDLETITGINARRIATIINMAGLWIVAFSMFTLAGLGTLAVWYRVEFAQAVFCLFLPMLIIAAMSVRTARWISAEQPQGKALIRGLTIHRLIIQGIGIVAILITSMWGMWMNLRIASF